MGSAASSADGSMGERFEEVRRVGGSGEPDRDVQCISNDRKRQILVRCCYFPNFLVSKYSYNTILNPVKMGADTTPMRLCFLFLSIIVCMYVCMYEIGYFKPRQF